METSYVSIRLMMEIMLSDNKFNINIAGRLIGITEPPYVIAELSANHNGNLDNALRIIEEAKKLWSLYYASK